MNLPNLPTGHKAPAATFSIALAMLLVLPLCGAAQAAEPKTPQTPQAADKHPTAMLFATGSVIGAQTTIRRLYRNGNTHMPQSVVDCIGQLQPQALEPFFESIIEKALSAEEVRESDAYWGSDAGLRKQDDMLVATYQSRGETPPVAVPAPLTREDIAAFDKFTAGKTAKKLLALQNEPAVKSDVNRHIQALLDTCSPQKAAP